MDAKTALRSFDVQTLTANANARVSPDCRDWLVERWGSPSEAVRDLIMDAMRAEAQGLRRERGERVGVRLRRLFSRLRASVKRAVTATEGRALDLVGGGRERRT